MNNSNQSKTMSVVLIVGLLITVTLIVFLAVMNAQKDVEEVRKIKETEVIAGQNAEDLGNAMQGVKEDIEAGYEDLDHAIEE